ncbi:LysR substrate-binding domain-containing protein [Streptomyces sp. NPDC015127]|uniref:LysR substrate-binding domain-containing protein n=1 Tax=Streptomyces sp. NPDC015127 TaxID=3364939 RepID=UPI0036F92F82
MPRFEHRVIDAEPIVVVSPDSAEPTPLELEEAGKECFILVPDTCGLTTFTTQLFQANEMPLRTYPGEAAGYQVLEDWTKLGLGSAMVPRSKLTSPRGSPPLAICIAYSVIQRDPLPGTTWNA